MEDGDIPLDNSEAERSIRDFAVLRHSTPSGFGSVKGAKSAEILSSFHETCKKFGLRLSEYMEFLFRKIGMFKDMLDDKKISSDEKRRFWSHSCNGITIRPKLDFRPYKLGI